MLLRCVIWRALRRPCSAQTITAQHLLRNCELSMCVLGLSKRWKAQSDVGRMSFFTSVWQSVLLSKEKILVISVFVREQIHLDLCLNLVRNVFCTFFLHLDVCTVLLKKENCCPKSESKKCAYEPTLKIYDTETCSSKARVNAKIARLWICWTFYVVVTLHLMFVKV